MKIKDALTAIKEILPAELHWLADPLADLTIWAYDKGWSDGIDDYREEIDPTEEQVWRHSR